MVSPEEDKREFDEAQKRRNAMAKKIKAAIAKEGIEFVLADIIKDPTMASIRFG